MEQANFHKQKLYALVIAVVALVALLLPWLSINIFGMSQSWNGFRGWGILSFLGILGVGALALLGDRSADYTPDFRNYTKIAFGMIALGAFLFFLRKNYVAGSDFGGLKTGIGLWLCLIAGLAGLALFLGFIKIETKRPV